MEFSDIVEDVDKQDYRTESGSDSEDDTQMPPGYVLPTPPRPRGEDGVYRVVLDEDIPVDFTEYFTDSEEEEEGDLKKPWADGRLIQKDGSTSHVSDVSHANTGEVNYIDTPNLADESRCEEDLVLNGTSDSAYDGDTST